MVNLPLSVERHYIEALQQCRQRKSPSLAKHLHAFMRQQCLESHPVIGNYLVPLLVDCGSLPDARHVFDRLPLRNEYSWSSIISGYVDSGELQHAFHLFYQMQGDGIWPNTYTFTALLRACIDSMDENGGRAMHSDITIRGLERDLFLGSTMVDMYSKCGSVAEARAVFDKLHTRDVVSWTALIAGYAEHGFIEEARGCFVQMQQDGVAPDCNTFVCGLNGCGDSGALEAGQEMHAEAMKRKLEGQIYISHTLVHLYAKCGSLVEARLVLMRLSVQDTVSWNALISGYADHGLGDEVYKCFKQMQLAGVCPDNVTFSCTLKACSMIKALETGQEIHAAMTKRGWEGEQLTGTTLVDMYAKCGLLHEAHAVFDLLPLGCAIAWNVLIAGYAEHGFAVEALKYFSQMQLCGTPPVAVTFICSLKACASLKAIEIGQEIHSEVTKRGLERELYVGNTLVDIYARCGLLTEALKMLHHLSGQNVVRWTALLVGYAENGFATEALKCFKQMQTKGVSPDASTYVGSLRACGIAGAFEIGQGLHTGVVEKGMEREFHVAHMLVDMYAKCGLFVEAWDLLCRLPIQTAMVWNALVAGYVELGLDDEALNCFKEMQLRNVSPDVVTFTYSLKACSIAGAIVQGQEIHMEMVRLGCDIDLFAGSILLDMYAGFGSLSEAQHVFDEMPTCDIVLWNAMIQAYSENHNTNMAIQCFKDMQEQGVKPDIITFTCLLSACSHASLVIEGQELFKLMKERHKLHPKVEHHALMVDLLARSGRVYEAERFAENMQCFSCKEILRVLLSACKIYGEVELGLRCFQQLVQVAEDDASAYLLMADIYASAGRWDDANKIEQMRKLAVAKKKLGSVSIELKQSLKKFTTGDSHSVEILGTLEILFVSLRCDGFIPNFEYIGRERIDKRELSSSEIVNNFYLNTTYEISNSSKVFPT